MTYKNWVLGTALCLSSLAYGDVVLEKINIQPGAYVLQKSLEKGHINLDAFKRNHIDVDVMKIDDKEINFTLRDQGHALRDVKLVALDNPVGNAKLSHLTTTKKDDFIEASLMLDQVFKPEHYALKWSLTNKDYTLVGMRNRSQILLKITDDALAEAHRVHVTVDDIKDDFNYTLSQSTSGNVLPINGLVKHVNERMIDINFANPAINVNKIQPISGTIELISEAPNTISIPIKEGVFNHPLLSDNQVKVTLSEIDNDLNKLKITYTDPNNQVRGVEVHHAEKKPKFFHQQWHNNLTEGTHEMILETDLPLSDAHTQITLVMANDQIIKKIPFKTPVLHVPKPIVLSQS
ncbi:MAG: hypothetical protein ACON5A_05940 [Candidatus Comchoanobacterales bacterium]